MANYAFSIMKDRDNAKDVVQDVFIDVHSIFIVIVDQTALVAHQLALATIPYIGELINQRSQVPSGTF